ncbi:acyltransferase [Maribacter sp. BPC-D8]|uniref:acyltransferase family protein n=1 Tax=Maribacter sp. BPC-D8 TaxID=3053613 RepID=UPI002B4982C0|nr:acyltransferase [Maribacter sp. BPC-D8]WRI30790.1 acyltransferase [Maribacter sp. BPC-D8]
MNRIYNLDYLRGLAAFGIMIYHYLTWTYGKFSAEAFLGKFGIYGVSIFYILSGLTLYYVYYNRMTFNKNDLSLFFRKRIFRIFPLLWLVTIFAIIISRNIPNFYDLFLNLTGLFGFLKWDTYFSPGAWSIGNELVFYIFLPIFILLSKSYKSIMIVLSIIIFSLYVYFAFFLLKVELPLSEQWTNYVNPLNQIFLFLGGFLIGLFSNKVKLNNTILSIGLLASILIFILYPVSGDTIVIVTGFNRLGLTACCLVICATIYKLSIKLPSFIHKPLMIIGETSYSIYLLHPLVYSAMGVIITLINAKVFKIEVPIFIQLSLSIAMTLLLSYFVYKYYERYFLKFGRKKTTHKNL